MRESSTLRKPFSPETFYTTIKRSDGVQVKIIGHPVHTVYDFYVVVEEAGIRKFKLWVYSVETEVFEHRRTFFKPKWKNDDELVISIPSQQAEISVFVNEAKATVREVKKYIMHQFKFH